MSEQETSCSSASAIASSPLVGGAFHEKLGDVVGEADHFGSEALVPAPEHGHVLLRPRALVPGGYCA